MDTKAERKTMKMLHKRPSLRSDEEEENETKFGLHLLLEATQSEFRTEHQVSPHQTPITHDISQITDTPTSEYQDPTYLPPQTPRYRCEMQTHYSRIPYH